MQKVELLSPAGILLSVRPLSIMGPMRYISGHLLSGPVKLQPTVLKISGLW